MSAPPGTPVTGSENPAATPLIGAEISRPSRTASASATRSSSSGWLGSGPAWRTNSQPRGAVMRPACSTHRSHECGSDTVASGPDDCRRVGVDKGQRRDRIVGAPGPAAATGNVHSERSIVRKRRKPPDTRAIRVPISNRYDLCRCGRFAHLDEGALDNRHRARTPAITPRPRNARAASSSDGSRLAQPRRTVRHGGAGGLRADRAPMAGTGVGARHRRRRNSPDRAQGSRKRPVAARGHRRRAGGAGPADTGGRRRPR